MIDWAETFKVAGAIIGPIAGGGGLFAYLAARQSVKSSPPAAITESQAELVSAVNEQTKTILSENTRLRRESNRDRRTLKHELVVLAKQVADCQTKHIECELKADELRIKVEELMRQSGAVAEYKELKRVAD